MSVLCVLCARYSILREQVISKGPEAKDDMDLPLSPATTTSTSSSPTTPTSPGHTPGLFHQGYGLEIQGYEHQASTDTEALVFLPQDTRYRIRLSNANDYMCMATVLIDGISIGQCPAMWQIQPHKLMLQFCNVMITCAWPLCSLMASALVSVQPCGKYNRTS